MSRQRLAPVVAIIAAVVVAGLTIGAIVTLAVTGTDRSQAVTDALIGITVPMVGSLLVFAGVQRLAVNTGDQLDAHAGQLATISDNTNGKLDARIREGVAEVLALAGMLERRSSGGLTPAPTSTPASVTTTVTTADGQPVAVTVPVTPDAAPAVPAQAPPSD